MDYCPVDCTVRWLKQLSTHACTAWIRQIVWETMEGERIKEKKSYKGTYFLLLLLLTLWWSMRTWSFKVFLRTYGMILELSTPGSDQQTGRIIYPPTCASHCWNFAWLHINYCERIHSVFLLYSQLWPLGTQVESERNVVHAGGVILSVQRGLKLAWNCFRHHSCAWDHSWKNTYITEGTRGTQYTMCI